MSFSAHLPDGWTLRPLEDLTVLLRRGKSPVYAETETEFPIVNQKCIEWGTINRGHLKYHTPDGLPPDEFFLQDRDVLLNSTGTGTIGRVAQFRQIDGLDHLADGHVTIVRINPTEANPKLVAELLSSEPGQRYLEAFCFTGSTNQLELSRRYLARLKLPLSGDIDEQARIADTLEEVDACIAATQASIAAAQKLKQALMQNLLTGKLKSDGTWRQEGDFDVDPKFGSIPKGWAIRKLKTIFRLKSGKGNTTENLRPSPDVECIIPVFGGNGITGYFHKPLIEYSTIIIGRVGEYCGAVRLTPKKSWVTDNAMFAYEFMLDASLEYLAYWLQHANLNRLAATTGQPKLTQGDIGKLVLIGPISVDDQSAIAGAIAKFDLLLVRRQEKLSALRELKIALMQNLLTGKIRIPAE